MIPRICEVPNALNNLSMLELLIKISINIVSTKSLHYDAIFIRNAEAGGGGGGNS